MESELKNAVNLADHQKATHLLENSKIQIQEENKHFSEKIT